jgi:putative hydrolase of HD superfamily
LAATANVKPITIAALYLPGLGRRFAFRDFLLQTSKMKEIPRSGWVSHHISLGDVESVADHTFSTTVLSMLLADLESKRGVKVDAEKVLRIAILHDLAESLTFDISKDYLEYLGQKGETMKREIEKSAWLHIAEGIKEPEVARQYLRLQGEYVKDKSKETKIVHAADSLDILLQVVNYERKGYPFALLSTLWNQQIKMVRRSTVRAAHLILKSIVNEERKLTLTKRIR